MLTTRGRFRDPPAPETLREYAAQAGFRRVDIRPVDHDQWRFYRLHP